MAAIVSPGVRRCLCGIRNGNSVLKAEFSQLVQTQKRDPRKLNLFVPTLLHNYTTDSTDDDDKRLVSLLTLKVRGSDEAVLESYAQFMRRSATYLDLDVSKKTILPMHIEKRTLLKSPHIYKKHRAQYELRTHTRMLQVKQLTGESADIYLEYIQRNLPEGVSMSIEQTDLEPIPEFMQDPSQK